MNEMTTTNLNRLATEINSIKEQTRKIVISASIEIGRRLKEAKSMVEYGTWGEWLESNVDYSQRTANNLVKVYDEYGSAQVNFLGETDSQALANLTYTQAVLLFQLPAEEREGFVQEHNVDEMTTRELQEAVKAKNSAEKHLEKEQELNKKISSDLNRAENSVIELKAKIDELEESDEPNNMDELKKTQDAHIKALEEKSKLEKQLTDLKVKLKEKPTEIIKEIIPAGIQKQLEELKVKAASDESPLMVKFKLQFKGLIDDISNLKISLEEVYNADGAEGNRCKNAVANLINKTLKELETNL